MRQEAEPLCYRKCLEGVGNSELRGLRGLNQGLRQVAGSTESYKRLLETRESNPNAQPAICKSSPGARQCVQRAILGKRSGAYSLLLEELVMQWPFEPLSLFIPQDLINAETTRHQHQNPSHTLQTLAATVHRELS